MNIKKTLLGSLLSLVALSASAQLAPVIEGTEVIDYGNIVITSYDSNYSDNDQISIFSGAKRIPFLTDKFVSDKVTIYFNFDSESLPYQSKQAIDMMLSNAPKNSLFNVYASADFLGAPSYNQLLSQRRANNIANYILQKPDVRVGEVIGLGESNAKLQKSCKKTRLESLVFCVAKDRYGMITINN